MASDLRVRNMDLTARFSQAIGVLRAERLGPAFKGWSGNDPQAYGRGWRPEGAYVSSLPVTASVSNGFDVSTFDRVHNGPPYREGGPFFSVKRTYPSQMSGNFSGNGAIVWPSNSEWHVEPFENWVLRYSGGFSNPVTSLNGNHYTSLSADSVRGPQDAHATVNPDDLSDLGARAMAKLRPKNAVGGLAQTVVEMRDMPALARQTAQMCSRVAMRMFGKRDWQRKPITAKEVADINLATNFGWLPLVKDVSDMLYVVRNFDQLVETRKRQMREGVTRVFREDVQTSEVLLGSESSSITNFCEPNLSSTGHDWLNMISQSTLSIRRQRMSAVWYKGKFKVWWPEFDTADGSIATELNQLRALLGLTIDPVTLWKVTPWSWLVDWFTGASDQIRLLQDELDNTVAAEYFYLMRSAYDRYEFAIQMVGRYGGGTSATWYRSVDTKRRVGGNAFGFTPKPELSGFQKGILASLAIKLRS